MMKESGNKGSTLLILLLISALIAGMLLPLFLGEELYARRTSNKSRLVRRIAESNTELSLGLQAIRNSNQPPPGLKLLPFQGSNETYLLETDKFPGKGLLLAISPAQFFPNWDLLLSTPSPCRRHTLQENLARGESAVLCRLTGATVLDNSSVGGNLSVDKLVLSPKIEKQLLFATKGSLSVKQLVLNLADASSIEIISRGNVEIGSLILSVTSRTSSLRIHSRQGKIQIRNHPEELYLGQGIATTRSVKTSLESSLGVKIGRKKFKTFAGCILPRDKLIWESLQVLGKTPLI